MTLGPITSQELARLRQAMFLGLARQPLAVPEQLQSLLAVAPDKEPALAVLALTGQRQRFERPAVEQSADGIPEAARHLHADQRPIIPEPARRLLLRLANGAEKSLADMVVRAAVRRIAHAGFRLHPFDLPRLIGHIKGDARCLGLAERAYLSLADASGSADAPSLLHAEISAESWTEFPKGHRVAFLRQERRRDPAAARALLEGAFKAETAAVRADLLTALDVGLGPDDLPFLEGLSADRSESVRNLAVRLAASVPGTPAYAARLAEVARCFERKDTPVSGIMKRVGLARSTPIRFTAPKHPSAAQRHAALESLFQGLSVREIAAAAALPVDEVVAALPASEEAVLTALSDRAVRDGDDEAVLWLIAHRLSHIDAGRFSAAPLLQWLADSLPGPVSAGFGETLLGSAQAALERCKEATTPAAMKDDGTLVWTATLLPPELLGAFQQAITGLLPGTTRSARDFADLALALDTLQPPQR